MLSMIYSCEDLSWSRRLLCWGCAMNWPDRICMQNNVLCLCMDSIQIFSENIPIRSILVSKIAKNNYKYLQEIKYNTTFCSASNFSIDLLFQFYNIIMHYRLAYVCKIEVFNWIKLILHCHCLSDTKYPYIH